MKGISSGKSFQARKKEIERLQTLGDATRERWQPYFSDDEDAWSIEPLVTRSFYVHVDR